MPKPPFIGDECPFRLRVCEPSIWRIAQGRSRHVGHDGLAQIVAAHLERAARLITVGLLTGQRGDAVEHRNDRADFSRRGRQDKRRACQFRSELGGIIPAF